MKHSKCNLCTDICTALHFERLWQSKKSHWIYFGRYLSTWFWFSYFRIIDFFLRNSSKFELAREIFEFDYFAGVKCDSQSKCETYFSSPVIPISFQRATLIDLTQFNGNSKLLCRPRASQASGLAFFIRQTKQNKIK